MKLTENERKVMRVLTRKFKKRDEGLKIGWEVKGDPRWVLWLRWWTPTQIGKAYDKAHDGASSWACRYLRVLLDRGLVVRVPPGRYAITFKGLKALGAK